MTSQLLRGRAVVSASRGFRSTRKGDLSDGVMAMVPVVVSPPGLGYSPDINTLQGGHNAFIDSQGVCPLDGKLSVDIGFSRMGAVDLPLGGEQEQIGFVDSPIKNATTGFEQPITGVFQMITQTIGEFITYVVTGLTQVPASGGDPIGSTTAYVWIYDPAADDWTNVPHGGSATGAEVASSRTDVYDGVFYPYGGTEIDGVAPGLVIFCHIDEEVNKIDIGAGVAGVGEYDTLFAITFGAADFNADSVELFDGRLVFLNTLEDDGTGFDVHPRRTRWTNIAQVAPSLTAAGSGFLDWEEFGGKGLRTIRLADMAVCYFEDGVGVIRRTFQLNAPFIRAYVSKTRGLISKFSVVSLNEDIHFGIFTDGWYMFDSGGKFTQLGTFQSGGFRWKRTFYRLLDEDNLNLLHCSYDPDLKRVRISWPQAVEEGQTLPEMKVWIYDITTDTVWPDDPYDVNTWGLANTLLQPGVSFTDLGTDTFADLQAAGTTFLDFLPVFGSRNIVHGTDLGLVFTHQNNIFTKDGVVVSWFLFSHKPHIADPFTRMIMDSIWVQYTGLASGEEASVSIQGANELDEVDGESIDMSTGATEKVVNDYVNMKLSGDRIGTRFTGTGPVTLHGWMMKFYPQSGDDQRVTGTFTVV